MTIRIVIENTGPGAIGVSPIYPEQPLEGTLKHTVRVGPQSKREFYVHRSQSLILNELNDEERST